MGQIGSTKLPMDLILVHSIETNYMVSLEADLHRYFADKHVRGEWYNLSEDEIEYFKAFGPAYYFYIDLAKKEVEKVWRPTY
jgi:hypothetical protein